MAVSLTAVGTLTLSPIVPGSRKQVRCRLTFDTSYPSGGYPLTAATFGLASLDNLQVDGTTKAGRLAAWDGTNQKLLVFKAVLTENDVADIHTDSVLVTAIGQ